MKLFKALLSGIALEILLWPLAIAWGAICFMICDLLHITETWQVTAVILSVVPFAIVGIFFLWQREKRIRGKMLKLPTRHADEEH